MENVEITAKMPVKIFKEGNYFIASAPSMNFASCGESVEEAKKNFVEELQIFSEEVFGIAKKCPFQISFVKE